MKIAIIFANLKGNLGDFAILHSMIDCVNNAYPESEIDVYSHPLVGIDDERLEKFRELCPGFNLIVKEHETGYSGIRKHITTSILGKYLQSQKIESFVKSYGSDFENFADYDAVIFSGGDQWSGKKLGHVMFGWLSSISQYNSNILSFPFSLKQSILKLYRTKKLKSYFDIIHPHVIVRDSLSNELMKAIGVNSQLGVDSVFTLCDMAEQIKPAIERDSSRSLFVVKGKQSDLELSIRKLLGNDVNIELLSTCPAEDYDVYNRISRKFSLEYRCPLTWQEVVSEFKSSEMVITNRLHGLILGTLSHVPVIPVVDRKKALAFAYDTQTPYHANTSAEITPDLIQAAASDRSAILERIGNYRQESCNKAYNPFTGN